MSAIAGVAIALRVMVFAIVCLRLGIGPERFAHLYDGNSYLIVAQAMLGDRSEFTAYHARVFGGYPALIASVASLGIPIHWASLGIDWICAGVAAGLSALVFRDRRIGWAMTMLIPHYLMNSSMSMSEAPLLAFTLGGIYILFSRLNLRLTEPQAEPSGSTRLSSPKSAAGNENVPSLLRPLFAGILFGCAGLIRPMACFAVIGAMSVPCYFRLIHRRYLLFPLILAIISGTTYFVTSLLLSRFGADPITSASNQSGGGGYSGEILALPFQSLILTPVRMNVPLGRVIYIWLHVGVTLAACGVLIKGWVRSRLSKGQTRDPRDVLALPWLVGNTLFVLCVGSVWGFECFHRFTVPAMPAMFWALRGFFPGKAWGWAVIGIVSGTIAVMSVSV